MPAMGAPVTIVGGTGGSATNPSFEQSVVALLGLTILSVPASPGATWVSIVALQ